MPATTNYRLGEAIEEFLLTRRASGIAPSTVAQNRVHLSQVLTEIGNIQVRNLTARHVDMVFASWTSKAPSTLNTQTSTLKTFLQWCGRRGLLPRGDDIMAAYTRRRKEPEKQRLQVPVDKFPALLDAATHPRDRMVVALGLYLFLRQSEIKTIRIGDVDFTNMEVAVTVHKTKQFDRMPISSELDTELRRYLEWYTAKCGVPQKQWFLTPSKYSVCATWADGRFAHDPSKEAVIRPTRAIGSPYRIIKSVLEDLGYDTFQEGCHTLRRSGARARFDALRDMGYDGALQEVRAMLHHASGEMTEHYLGLHTERLRRNESVKGRPMYPSIVADVAIVRSIVR